MGDHNTGMQHDSQYRNTIQEIHQCNENAYQLHYVDPVKGLALAKEAHKLCTSGDFAKSPYTQGLADSLLNLAFYQFYNGEIESALLSAEESQNLYIKLNQLLPQVELFAIKGLIFDTYDDRNQAIEYLIRGLDIAKRENFELTEGKILLLIGVSYYHMKNYRQSIHSILQAKQIFERFKQQDFLALSLVNLTKAYSNLNQQEKAFECIYEALQIAVDHNFHVVESEGFYNLGIMHFKNNEFDIARSHLKYSQRIAKKFHLKYFNIKARLGLGQILLNRYETSDALILYKQCLKESQEIGIDRLVMETHRLMSEIYEVLHSYKKSLHHFKNYSDLSSKVFNKESQQKTQSIEVLFRTKSARLEADFTRRKNVSLEKEIVERKKIEEELRNSEQRYRKMASYDPLTKLFNRRHFFNLAEIEYERANRYNHDLSVMMIDLDHFKLINDQYGHIIGDEMLTFVAGLCKKNLRKIDLIGRYGGEEFIVLLPQTGSEDALSLANRLCEVIGETSMTSVKGKVQITVSIGVSVNGESIERLEKLFDLADQALYRAKENGRNQVAFANDENDHVIQKEAENE
jgi:diguanylate cyclase (GGDEF)-like protein